MNLRETFRYLGYHGQEPDEAAKNLAVICWKELEQAATPRSFYREYPLEFTGETGIVTPVFETQSANLRKNLKDCEKLLVFAATLGAGGSSDPALHEDPDEQSRDPSGSGSSYAGGLL